MGDYPMGRQATSFKKVFDVYKEKPHLKWLDEPFIHFLFKQECARRTNKIMPPLIAINSPTPI
jgi:hypothetical protein